MNEHELLRIVQTLTLPGPDVTGDQLEQLTDVFQDEISHPGGTDLLYYPDSWGLSANPSPQEIVKEALCWKPRVIAMAVTYVRRHPNRDDLFCYGVEVKGKIRTQVVSPLKLNVGDICAVALSGIVLSSGHRVRHGFVDRAYSAGEILGVTDEPPGVELPVS